MMNYLKRRIETMELGEILYLKNAELKKTDESVSWNGGGTQWAPIEGPGFHLLVNGTDEDSCDCVFQFGELWRVPSGLRINFLEDFSEG